MRHLGWKVALAAGLVALWEVGNSWWDAYQSDRRYDFWRNYYDKNMLSRVDALRQVYSIRSTGVNLHIDVYARPEADAPVILINHGAGAYCRLFVPLALMFYDRGYTVVLPDQRGNGYSGGRRGDFTVSEATQNIVDAARWSKKMFGGAQFLFGVSLGGAMTYYAAAAGAPADALACLNLMDFGRLETGVGLARAPRLVPLAAKALPLEPLIGWFRLPVMMLGRFENAVDGSEKTLGRLERDPMTTRLFALRTIASMITTSPKIPFEQNTIPALVMNQGADRMIDQTMTRKSYRRLGGEKKYIELEGYNHWSLKPDFWIRMVDESDAWFQEHLNRPNPEDSHPAKA